MDFKTQCVTDYSAIHIRLLCNNLLILHKNIQRLGNKGFSFHIRIYCLNFQANRFSFIDKIGIYARVI